MGCYLANVRKEKLGDKYHSIQDILNEMPPIRFIEHPGTKPFITPFIGKQIGICDAFGFDIPDGCSPEYAVRRTNKGKLGRPRKNRLVVKDFVSRKTCSLSHIRDVNHPFPQRGTCIGTCNAKNQSACDSSNSSAKSRQNRCTDCGACKSTAFSAECAASPTSANAGSGTFSAFT